MKIIPIPSLTEKGIGPSKFLKGTKTRKIRHHLFILAWVLYYYNH